MRLNRSTLATAAAIGLVAAGGSAFTAANTGTPLTSAGQKSEVTTGFAVSAVDYVLAPNASGTGSQLDKITFTLTADATHNISSEARVQLVGGAAYYACTVVAGATAPAVNWTCSTPGLEVNLIDKLNIVAVSN